MKNQRKKKVGRKILCEKKKKKPPKRGEKKRALRVFVTYDREYQRKNGKKFGQMCSALFRGEIGFRPFFFFDERGKGKTSEREKCVMYRRATTNIEIKKEKSWKMNETKRRHGFSYYIFTVCWPSESEIEEKLKFTQKTYTTHLSQRWEKKRRKVAKGIHEH